MTECAGKLAAGDLVITEVMANPSGPDTGKEWFEVRNTRSTALDLTGLQIVAEKDDSTGPMTHTVVDQTIAAGAYLVFGGAAPDVDYDYGDDLALRNEGGQIILKCGTVVVATAIYQKTTDGAALSFDGESWCDATAATPGASNAPCSSVVPAGMCQDDEGHVRAILPPGPGDLVVSEIMADPSTVADSAGEWFEVTVMKDVDLNGLAMGVAESATAMTHIADDHCLRRSAGARLVFARSADAALNGGLPTVEAVVDFSLANGNGSLVLTSGDTVVDRVAWTGATAGKARSLDPTRLDADENDDPASWCPSAQTYGTGDFGTPGAANESCMPERTDTCLDSDGVTHRPIVAPAVGDLLITEVMPNAATSSESGKEWFEVRVARDVDLVGLSVASGIKSTAFSMTDCQRVAAGTFLVFANGPPATSMLPRTDYTFDFTLVNSSSQVSVLVSGELLDSAVWNSTTDGTSRTLKKSRFDTVGNDSAMSFCASQATYGDGTNRGTPGADDPSCE